MGITLHGMQHSIHDRIADVSTCRVRQLAGIALCLYPAHHGLDRQLGKICRGTVLYQRFVHRLRAVIIWDTGIRQVDGYPFYTQTSSAACLAHIQHQIRLAKFDLAHHFCGAAGKACRDLPLDDLRPGNFIRQHFNSFVSRVDAFPSERVKACN